jgi:hypothetical protein
MHPILIAALANDRHRLCFCDSVAQRPDRLCRNCHRRHYLLLQDVAASSQCSVLGVGKIRRALPFAWVSPLLQSISKGCQD